MRRGSAALTAVLAGAPLLLLAAPAQAEERLLGVDASAWSWRRTLPADSPVAEPSQVPAGRLAVAFDGRPDAPPAKATYLRLALGDLPRGTTVSSLQLVLPLDPEVQQDPTAAPLVACRLTAPFTTGEAVDPAKQPAEDCRGAAQGRYDAAAGTVSFSLTSAMAEWLGGGANHGVVVRPDPAAAVPGVLPFQLVFLGASSVVGRLDAAFPVVTGPAAPPVEEPVAPALPPPAAGVPLLPGVDTASPPAVPAQEPVPPAVSAPQQPLAEALPPAPTARVTAPSYASEAGFATAAALGALLLALVAFASGDSAAARVFARAERRRLDRVRRVEPTGQLVEPEQSLQGRRPFASATSSVTTS